jgi:hypothetical protein
MSGRNETAGTMREPSRRHARHQQSEALSPDLREVLHMLQSLEKELAAKVAPGR